MSRKEYQHFPSTSGGTAAGGDAPGKESKVKKGADHSPPPAEEPKTPSQIAIELAEERAEQRRMRFKRRWPEVTKVEIKTKKWRPPVAPRRVPKLYIEIPEVRTRKWIAPYKRRRRMRPRLQRIPPEMTSQPLYEYAKLKKTWRNFCQVGKNKMMLQCAVGCDPKRAPYTCGGQSGAFAMVCRALLEEKSPGEMSAWDIEDVIRNGENYYKLARIANKCYKGSPNLSLSLMPQSFYMHDTRYTIKLNELERGVLLKHPDNMNSEEDLLQMMDRRIGQTYCHILTVGENMHFLIWGHPPGADGAANVKTICYLFDPHTLNDEGQPTFMLYCCGNRVDKYGGAAILRYAGVQSFVSDFLANYGDLEGAKSGKKAQKITLTDCEIVQKEPLNRIPDYELELKALKLHCRSEWDSLNVKALYDKKLYQGKYPLASISKVSLATSRSSAKRKLGEFYQRKPQKDTLPQLPVAPEKGPPGPTQEQIMQLRGEDFFLYCPKHDAHTYGRDDMLPLAKSEIIFHSPVDIADNNFHSQYKQLDVGRWILRGTRHFACQRYDAYKYNTALSCCVAALGMLRRLRARAWNEDTVNECLDVGSNIFRESLIERRGPMRTLTLGELRDTFNIRNNTYKFKQRGIAVWGKIVSNNNNKVFDLCRGIEAFFKESDAGVLQIPGEYETAIWQEGGRYYVFHPWPTDQYGRKIGLREGGKSAVLQYSSVGRLCEHFLQNAGDMKRKPFSISDVTVSEQRDVPEPVGNFKSVASNRWVIRGRFHEGDARFPEEHRNKQATPISIAAIAIAHIHEPSGWTSDNVDESLIRGDILYQLTMEHLDSEGNPNIAPKEEEAEEEEVPQKSGMAAAEVLTKFQVSEYDCIETEVMDSMYSGSLQPEGDGVASLKDGLKSMFEEYTHGVVTARGSTIAVWKHEDSFYLLDPHGCDENGYASEEPRAAACLIRLKGTVNELVKELETNLPPGTDNSFNISPVIVTATKLNYEIGAPETNVESKAFQWIRPGTAAIMMGPRGENSAIGKSAEKAGVPKEDLAGRTIALPAAAAFVAAAAAVPPPHMHKDHMFNFLDAGADYYLNHVKKTGKSTIEPEDLTEKFEMGTNTFSIELGDPLTYPLRLPDRIEEEAEEEEERELGEGEEEPGETAIKEMKYAMYSVMSKPNSLALLVGDYHQLGVWCNGGGKVVVFDPAPTLAKGMLTFDRIKKGDELRTQRLKDLARQMAGEGDMEEGEEEMGGEEKVEPEPGPVPPDTCPTLMVFASPSEFIDKLASQGPLGPKQHIAPYKLYPVRVINELTSVLKEKKKQDKKRGAGDEEEEEDESEALIEAIGDDAMGKYFEKMSRSVASLRGRVAQGENYFMEIQRDNQDVANAVMGIVVHHIEPYIHWKPTLIDAILKYGDRLHTMSALKANKDPPLNIRDIIKEFHVTNFNVKVDINPDVVVGDLKAARSGKVLNLQRALEQFFANNQFGVLCSKNYCVAIWKAADEKSYLVWEPHAVGPTGRASPGGAASTVIYSVLDEVADTFKHNIHALNKTGSNKFTISSVTVAWEISKIPAPVTALTIPDEGYEFKVLTAYVETARGKTILRGSRPPAMSRFIREALLQSSCGAIVGVCMSHVRKAHLWTRRTVDEIMMAASKLFASSLCKLGYEFRPGEDILLPLQVAKRFVLGVNYVRFDIASVYTGKLEPTHPSELGVRAALERFFESHTHGLLWSVPHAVGVWRSPSSPNYYMMEPHACGPTGLRIDAQENGAACVLTFATAKLMAHAYVQNIPMVERPKHEFHLYAMSVIVQPIGKLGRLDPPLLYGPSSVKLVPATSKIYLDGRRRRADEEDRKHPPGDTTCQDMQRATDNIDKDVAKLKGVRNTSGWLVLSDGSQYLSANHSQECRRYTVASRGYQALSCSVMAVAMSRVQEVCKWCTSTLDDILDSGDQLYQDSYLHYKPSDRVLTPEQILRKFYTPENCVCRVVVYEARQVGCVDGELVSKLEEFFNEEKAGVLVAEPGLIAVALFRTARGYYMFDPGDRDRYGRAVAPPCRGRARACFSHYPTVKMLAERLAPNIPPVVLKHKSVTVVESKAAKNEPNNSPPGSGVVSPPVAAAPSNTVEVTAMFKIYGMDVSALRRINKYEN